MIIRSDEVVPLGGGGGGGGVSRNVRLQSDTIDVWFSTDDFVSFAYIYATVWKRQNYGSCESNYYLHCWINKLYQSWKLIVKCV